MWEVREGNVYVCVVCVCFKDLNGHIMEMVNYETLG